jgi:phosphoesterase RecJ-like protein
MIDKVFEFQQMMMDLGEVDVICHTSPDADALGSMFAIANLVKELGVDKVNKVCLDSVPESLKTYFPGIINNISEESKVVIVVDCGDFKRSGLNLNDISGKLIVNIDHHSSNDNFGDLNIVELVSSTCEIVYDFFRLLNLEISFDVAQWIGLGILFDTGGLHHSNTSSKVLRVIGELAAKGVVVDELNKVLFAKYSANDLKVLGVIFKRAKINENGVLSCVLSESEILESSCDIGEIKKAIDYLNQVEGKKVALLGFEEAAGGIKFSIRSNCDHYDVSKIAQLFEGGGHKRASGFSVQI